MKHNIAIIGLGVIYRQHIQALQHVSNIFQLTAICDINDTQLAEGHKLAETQLQTDNIAAYTDIRQCLQSRKADTILIATPPHTHYQLAQQTLSAGYNTIIEKPAVLHTPQLHQLYNIAEEHNVTLHIAFHAAYAADLLWYNTHRQETEQNYNLGKLRQITCQFYDPYVNNGILDKGRETLGGSYIDSTVNELSVVDTITPLDTYTVSQRHETQNNDGITISSQLQLHSTTDKPIVSLITDWTKGINQKTTTLTYDNNTTILLDHSRQTVTLHDNTTVHLLYDNHDAPRLPTQYANLLTDYHHLLNSHQDNRRQAIAVHQLLLESKHQK